MEILWVNEGCEDAYFSFLYLRVFVAHSAFSICSRYLMSIRSGCFWVMSVKKCYFLQCEYDSLQSLDVKTTHYKLFNGMTLWCECAHDSFHKRDEGVFQYSTLKYLNGNRTH